MEYSNDFVSLKHLNCLDRLINIPQLATGHCSYFNWRSKYSGVSAPELKKMKELEAENAKPKRM